MKFLRSLLIPHHTNTYKPHLIRRHGLALVLVMMLSIQQVAGLQSSSGQNVLGYASNITVNGLLSGTNSNRVSNGLPALSLNSQLNSAAQSKANHMVNNDYWAHNAPDGTTPWYFFDQAGYVYLAAGENLAYGFDTSSGTITGWMNSPGHRANILHSDYEEVGFGIANGSSFQGGQNTVVVAHYGDPVQTSPAPQTQEQAQNSQQPVAQATPSNSPQQLEETTEEPEAEKQEEATQNEESENEDPDQAAFTIIQNTPGEKRISNLEAITTGAAHWSLYATAGLLLLVALIYAYRHVLFIHNTIIKGEKFVAHHPLLEASLIYIVLWLLLTGTHGVIF